MRWLRFTQLGITHFGLLEAGRIAEVEGSPFTQWQRSGRSFAPAEVVLEIPVVPPTFFAAGQNYVQHARHYPGSEATAAALPTQPDVGIRGPSSLIAHDQPVVIPADSSGSVQYEGELVVVIGRTARHLTPANVFDHILGYTIGNDISERSWQKSDRTTWRAKNADSFSPMGPWIETDVDLAAMQTIVRTNGVETTRFRTAEMLFGITDFLVRMSRSITLHPGDLMWMGTEGRSPDLHAGDVVEVELTGIGTLRNPIIAGSMIPAEQAKSGA